MNLIYHRLDLLTSRQCLHLYVVVMFSLAENNFWVYTIPMHGNLQTLLILVIATQWNLSSVNSVQLSSDFLYE